MKLTQVLFLTQATAIVWSYNLFKAATETTRLEDQSVLRKPLPIPRFDPAELLDARSRKPEIYTKAMIELKRLEEEPLCHRLAAQMLMNNCQGLENFNENDYQFNSVQFQRHHIESFAASLALCDLERGRFSIPDACTPFTSTALLRVSQENRGSLEVSPEQVGQCLEALGQHHSHWNTWLSYRDKALLFCRASRIDIDKDQSILLHKQLTKVMKDFADGMEKDLGSLREAVAKHTRTTESYFRSSIVNVEVLNSKIRATFDSFSEDISGATSSLKAILSSTSDVQQVLKNIFKTVVQTNIEMAMAQEHAMEATTTRTRSRLEDIDNAVGATETSVDNLRITVEMLIPVLESMLQRQEALDLGAENIYARMDNITALLENHQENLRVVSATAADFHETLGKTMATAESWDEKLQLGSKTSDSLVIIGSGLFTLLAGNYGLAPSLPRNAMLFVSGLAMGECLNLYRRSHWNLNSSQATAFTHLAKEWSVAASPETSKSIATTTLPGDGQEVTHIEMS